jgi:hypothetical protein
VNFGIFLDFDGVLHPSRAILGLNQTITKHAITSRALFRWTKHLEEIVEAAPQSFKDGLCIAAHSSWRTLKNLDQNLIRESLGNLAPYYVGMTNPSLGRWESIQDMAERAQFDSFIVLDDSYKEFPENQEQLIVCNPLEGISDTQITQKIVQWIETQTPVEKPKSRFGNMAVGSRRQG